MPAVSTGSMARGIEIHGSRTYLAGRTVVPGVVEFGPGLDAGELWMPRVTQGVPGGPFTVIDDRGVVSRLARGVYRAVGPVPEAGWWRGGPADGRDCITTGWCRGGG